MPQRYDKIPSPSVELHCGHSDNTSPVSAHYFRDLTSASACGLMWVSGSEPLVNCTTIGATQQAKSGAEISIEAQGPVNFSVSSGDGSRCPLQRKRTGHVRATDGLANVWNGWQSPRPHRTRVRNREPSRQGANSSTRIRRRRRQPGSRTDWLKALRCRYA